MRYVPPTHAQLSGAPCVSAYDRHGRSSTPVSSAMYGSESDSCLSGRGVSNFQATVLRGKNSAVIGLLPDHGRDPVEALAHVCSPVRPLVLAGPFVIYDRRTGLFRRPPERAVLI